MSNNVKSRFHSTTFALAGLLAVFATVSLGAFQKPAAGQKSNLDITLTSKPSPPMMGENTFEVTVKDADGKPITDGEVSVMFHMAAMPEMKMPEMKNSVTLKHQKEGRYVGTGQVTMAGKWDATVTVKRAGKELGSKKFPITAK